MPRYRVTPAARSDLFEIWSYIAADSPSSADRVEAEIRAAFEMLAGFPLAGHLRPDLTDKPLRFFPVRSYMIVYRAAPLEITPLEIIRVVHGARNLVRLLGSPK